MRLMEALFAPVASAGLLVVGIAYLRRPFAGRARLAYATVGAVILATLVLLASVVQAII
jgi:hypothetical protein